MTLLQAWGDSLTLLQPKNLKPFIFVTFKSIIETYKLLFKYWWWLYVVIVAVGIGMNYVSFSVMPSALASQLFGSLLFSLFALLFLHVFASFLAACPSIAQKNYVYFKSYILYFAIVPFFIAIPVSILYISQSCGLTGKLSLIEVFSRFVVSLPLTIFALLFFFDSKMGVKSFLYALFNAIKMIVFNLPLCIILGILVAVFLSTENLIRYNSRALYFIVPAMFAPVFICVYVNIYIKKLQDQYDLYFPQPK